MMEKKSVICEKICHLLKKNDTYNYPLTQQLHSWAFFPETWKSNVHPKTDT